MHELLLRAARWRNGPGGCSASRRGPAALPAECTGIATVDGNRVRLTTGGSDSIDAEMTGVPPGYLDDLVSALAPLVDPDAPGAAYRTTSAFPACWRRPRSPKSMARQWQRPSMATAIGASTVGPLIVDLERDGPHVLIAGTTGSGKSELLQTLIAGLACAAPPDRHTTFLLIDYKGGAAFGRLDGSARIPSA